MTKTTLTGNWSYPTAVRMGAGRISELAEACRTLGMARPLLVTDPGLKALPMVIDALKANDAAGLTTGLFYEVKPNPLGSNVDAGVQAFTNGNHDGVIAFGSGRPSSAYLGLTRVGAQAEIVSGLSAHRISADPCAASPGVDKRM